MSLIPRSARPCSPLQLTASEVETLGAGGVVVRDDLLPRDTALACADAAAHLDAIGRLSPAHIGRERSHRPDLRGDRHAWFEQLDLPPALQSLWAAFDDLRITLNRDAWLGLQRFALQLACYPGAGTRYVPHVDALAGDPGRRVTAIVYLNPAWTPSDGGALRVECPDGERTINPELGRLVLFLSEWVRHEVLPTHAVRFAATAWFRGAEAIPFLPDPPAARRGGNPW